MGKYSFSLGFRYVFSIILPFFSRCKQLCKVCLKSKKRTREYIAEAQKRARIQQDLYKVRVISKEITRFPLSRELLYLKKKSQNETDITASGIFVDGESMKYSILPEEDVIEIYI